MQFKIQSKPGKGAQVYIIDQTDTLKDLELSDQELAFVTASIASDQSLITINRYTQQLFIYFIKPKKTNWQTAEAIRKGGAELGPLLQRYKMAEITLHNNSAVPKAALLLAQGLALAAYQFLKYHTTPARLAHHLKIISFSRSAATVKEVDELNIITDAVYRARTLVNEPLNYLSAVQLSREITAMGKEAGFKVTVLGKEQILKEGMGGILAVNRGSMAPPTFTIMEHKPKKALNKQPIVLVGKGIVYDTGGLSLKPTPNSMDRMKSDMSGAALVSTAMYAIARMGLPLHVIALVPATDNRPGEDAYVPGDVIKMYSGATVEVLNTDAEGRMVLADALHWAKRYKPEIVLDFATLTGAASAAVGEHGIVYMGTADVPVKEQLAASGYNQYERLVEYPLWDEYGDQIKSDIADLKNVGGPTGGAITAGKFLEHFTAYPWVHFDIAGVSFATAKRGYMPVGGTGYGLRMLLDFLMNYGNA
jgi:leucyl aminopeptidase